MCCASAVVDRRRLERQNFLPDRIAIKQIDLCPLCQLRDGRWRSGPSPAHQVACSCKVLKEMATGKAGRPGDKDARGRCRHVPGSSAPRADLMSPPLRSTRRQFSVAKANATVACPADV